MDIKTKRYSNSSIEELLASKFKEYAESVKIGAQSFASRNLPQLLGDNMRYFEEFHLHHQQLIDTVSGIIQPETSVHEVVEHGKSIEQENRDLNNKLIAAKTGLIATKAKIESKSSPISELKAILCWLAILIICLFDGLMSISVFESAGFAYGEAILVAILLSGGLAIACHYSTKIIHLGKTTSQRRLIVFAITLFMSTLFYCMTKMRVQFLTETLHGNDSEIHHSYSPISFILFSVFFFCVGVAISYFSMPTKEQLDYLRQYNRLKSEALEGEEIIKSLEIQKAAINKRHGDLLHINGSMLMYGSAVEERIIHHAHAMYALFKKECLMYRTDNGKPSCFDHPYPFAFSTNFHQYKSMNHEILQ